MPQQQDNFWAVLADYCSELAPIVGPLVSSIGDTAAAIERAQRPDRRTLNVTSTPRALPD